MSILQSLIICIMPLVWMYATAHWKIEKWLSPVVLCYLTGILFANSNFISLNPEVSVSFSEFTVVLAIPLLLYSTDLVAWFRYAGSTVLSFFLCIISGVLCSGLVAWFFNESVENSWMISGMLVGVYTGGSPNLNAIGVMLEAKSETLVLLNGADIFCGGIYLIFLTSIAFNVFSKILPAFEGDKLHSDTKQQNLKVFSFKNSLLLFVLTSAIVGLTIGASYLIFGNLKSLSFILLMLTSVSILVSLVPGIRNIKGSFEIGEYLLLMFCIAIGMQADFSTLVNQGGSIILFTACVLSFTVLLHLLLSKVFKIDVETFMITSTAALYGPVFIGQIASTIKNRTLVVSGMATGLVGYAIGNYLGYSVAQILKSILN